MGKAQKAAVIEAVEDEVEEAIRLCDGDLRRTIRELILGQRQIDQAVSAGYVRKGLRS
jgi:hypothetical protein